MNVCSACKEYGQVIKRLPTVKEKKYGRSSKERAQGSGTPSSDSQQNETLLLVSPEYSKRIKSARERMGLKQEVLAKRLKIKESMLQIYEGGHRKPNLETARLLEKALHITLVEEHIEKHKSTSVKVDSGPLTIADILKKSAKR